MYFQVIPYKLFLLFGSISSTQNTYLYDLILNLSGEKMFPKIVTTSNFKNITCSAHVKFILKTFKNTTSSLKMAYYLKLCTFLFIIQLYSLHANAQPDWKLKKDKNGIKVYTKDHITKNLKYYRLQAEFEADYEKIVRLNLDFDNYESWIRDCEESEILEVDGAKHLIYYAKYNAPWPASDRDFVSEVQIEQNENSTAFVTLPSEMDYPIKDGVVRVKEYQDSWKITRLDNGKVKIELEGFYNPGGSVPRWIVNMFIIDAPYESMVRLRDLTK